MLQSVPFLYALDVLLRILSILSTLLTTVDRCMSIAEQRRRKRQKEGISK